MAAIFGCVLNKTGDQLVFVEQLAHQVSGELGDALIVQYGLQNQIEIIERMLSGWGTPAGIAIDLELPLPGTPRGRTKIDATMLGELINVAGQAVRNCVCRRSTYDHLHRNQLPRDDIAIFHTAIAKGNINAVGSEVRGTVIQQ